MIRSHAGAPIDWTTAPRTPYPSCPAVEPATLSGTVLPSWPALAPASPSGTVLVGMAGTRAAMTGEWTTAAPVRPAVTPDRHDAARRNAP